MPVKEFPYFLARPAQRALQHAGIHSLQQLSSLTEKQLADLHGMGPNAIEKMKEAMNEQGLKFRS